MLLTGFVVLQSISLCRNALAVMLGDWIIETAGYLNGGSCLLLGLATASYKRHSNARMPLFLSVWVWALGVCVLINSARGYYSGLDTKYVVYDTMAFIVLICFVILGSIPEAFEQIKRLWLWALVIAIPLNVFALLDLQDLTQELTAGIRVARETISYRTQNALDVLVLCVAFAFQYRSWQRTVIAGGVALVLLQQVLYQKRLETIFYVAFIALIALIWGSADVAVRRRLRRHVTNGFVVATTIMLAVGVVWGEYLIPQAQALGSRLTGQTTVADDAYFEGSRAQYYLMENERFSMVRDSLGMLDFKEILTGRGMGGAVELHKFDLRVLESPDSEQYWSAYYLPDYKFFGRRGFEVGMATPILKGGVVLWLLYYSAFFWVLLHIRQLWKSLFGRLASAVVLSYWIYTGFGGDFALSMAFQLGTTASCLGACFGVIAQQRTASSSVYLPRPAPPPRLDVVTA